MRSDDPTRTGPGAPPHRVFPTTSAQGRRSAFPREGQHALSGDHGWVFAEAPPLVLPPAVTHPETTSPSTAAQPTGQLVQKLQSREVAGALPGGEFDIGRRPGSYLLLPSSSMQN
ncbi:MAG: hypothetical protein IPM55_20920 [Acidobacteria bacterium]|nr:hypothetical protein [Acidobacteriota bacterium]